MVKKANWLVENPIDYYNRNHADDALEIFEKSNKCILKLALGKYTAVLNKGDEEITMFEFRDGYLNVLEQNILNLEVGAQISPFGLFLKFKMKNNFYAAVMHIGVNYMDMEFPFIRVGIKYFKTTKYEDRFGVVRQELTPWNKEEIKQDYGAEMLERVTKYDNFVVVPDNINYQATIGNNYNWYSKFEHIPVEGNCDWSLAFLSHIFDGDLDLGLKYMKVIYERPTQALPILVLISEDRSTGKSTFLDWNTQIWGSNMVIVNPSDLGSNFNEAYAMKNVIGIEESRFDKASTLEKLKAISTQKTINVNVKHVSCFQVPFFGKIIITSNDERKFSKVDDKEIRYWVRKVPTIPEDKANHDILSDLRKEIPAFIYHLIHNVPEIDYSKSRMVFTPKELRTNALDVVVKESRSTLHKDIEMYLNEVCSNYPSKEELFFRALDVKEHFFRNNNAVGLSYVDQVLNHEMHLERTERERREVLFAEHPTTVRGRHYIYPNPYFNKQNDEQQDDQGKEWFEL